MRIVPEQYVKLRKKLYDLERQRENNYEYMVMKNNELEHDDTMGLFMRDQATDNRLMSDMKTFDKYNKLLSNGKVVYEPNLDYIDIGTKFVVTINNGKKKCLTLVEDLCGLGVDGGFVSISSPIGSAVYKKKDNDVVKYRVGNDKRELKIDKIIRDKNKYMSTINRDYYISDDPELLTMSTSQKKLLIDELNELDENININNKEEFIKRIREIENIFRVYDVVDNNDNTIGIGNIFSLKLEGNKDTYNINNVEMINRALGNELKPLYIERVNKLGSLVYGLSDGDETFTMIDGNKYKVTVTSVLNNRKNKVL